MSLHSIEAGICGLATTLRWAAKASHKITTNISTATNEIMDPTDDRIFHIIMASG